jgi:Rieske Fe-S protein
MAKKDSLKKPITRRSFCNGVLLASTAVALKANGFARSEILTQEVFSIPPMRIEGAEQVMPGSFLYFDYPTHKDAAVLIRADDGEYFAYNRKCAHLGCSVDYNVGRRCLVCPCHQGAYDERTGYRTFGPPPKPLEGIVLQIRAGNQVWAVGKTIIKNQPNA